MKEAEEKQEEFETQFTLPTQSSSSSESSTRTGIVDPAMDEFAGGLPPLSQLSSPGRGFGLGDMDNFLLTQPPLGFGREENNNNNSREPIDLQQDDNPLPGQHPS